MLTATFCKQNTQTSINSRFYHRITMMMTVTVLVQKRYAIVPIFGEEDAKVMKVEDPNRVLRIEDDAMKFC